MKALFLIIRTQNYFKSTLITILCMLINLNLFAQTPKQGSTQWQKRADAYEQNNQSAAESKASDEFIFNGAKIIGVAFVAGYGLKLLDEYVESLPQRVIDYDGCIGDCQNGYGELQIADSVRFKGQWLDGAYNGKGTLYFKNVELIGSFKDGHFKQGKVYLNQEVIYEGSFVNGKLHGNGVEFFEDYFYNLGHEEMGAKKAKVVRSGKFENGNFLEGIVELIDKENNQIKTRCNFPNVYPYLSFYPNGNTKMYIGENDSLQTYREDGRISFDGRFINDDITTGAQYYYHEEGVEIVMPEYFSNDGNPQGYGTKEEIYYDDNEKWKYVGTFSQGSLEGNIEIYVNDTIFYRGQYSENNGGFHGLGVFYFTSGDCCLIPRPFNYFGQFSNGVKDGRAVEVSLDALGRETEFLVLYEKDEKIDQIGMDKTSVDFNFLKDILASQNTFPTILNDSTLLDNRDGHIYTTRMIQNKKWIVEDMKFNTLYGTHRGSDGMYYYDHTMADLVCPKGWHLPNKQDWQNVVDYIQESRKKKYKRTSKGWIKKIRPELKNNLQLSDAYLKQFDYVDDQSKLKSFEGSSYWLSAYSPDSEFIRGTVFFLKNDLFLDGWRGGSFYQSCKCISD